MNVSGCLIRRLVPSILCILTAATSVGQISVAASSGARPNAETDQAKAGVTVDLSSIAAAMAALAPANASGKLDFTVASSSTVDAGLCLQYGTSDAGLTASGNCVTWSNGPKLAYVGAASNAAAGASQIFLEDAASNSLYVLTSSPAAKDSTSLAGLIGHTVQLPPGIRPGSLTVADINGDNRPDLLYTADAPDGSGASINVQFGTVDGSFGPAVAVARAGADLVASGRFRASAGTPGLVALESGNLVPYTSGDGQHFTPMPPLPGTPSTADLTATSLLLTDLDADGNADVAALYSPVGGSGPAQLYIWWGNGDGTFAAPSVFPLSHAFTLAAVADRNRDGRPDLLLAGSGAGAVLSNLGGRVFRGETPFSVGQGVSGLAATDLNGDGTPDVFIATGAPAGSTAQPLASSSASAAHPRAASPQPHVACVQGTTGCTSSSVAVDINPYPPAQPQSFTITVTVTGNAPTGTVQIFIDTNLIATVNLTGAGSTKSTATYTVAGGTFPGGYHQLTVGYPGDANNTTAVFNANPPGILISDNTTSTALCVQTSACPAQLSSSPYPPITISYGQVYYASAVVTANNGNQNSLSGTVTFNDSHNGTNTVLCTLALGSQGGGNCPSTPPALPAGTNSLTAVYSNDPTNAGSTSPAVTVNVLQDTTTAAVTGSPNPAVQGSTVTLTATLTGNVASPTGQVTFLNGSTPIGTATLAPSGGAISTAILTTNSLPLGTNPITVNFAGSANFQSATSPVFNEVIQPSVGPASFTLAVGPSPINIGVGLVGALQVTITPQNGFSQAVHLSCSGLPNEANCSFVAPTITGGGITTLYLQTTAPHTCGTTTPYFLGSNGGPDLGPLALPALAGLLVGFLPGRKRMLRSLLSIALVATVMQISGCGHCTDLGTRPNAYHIQVNATTSGSVNQTQTQTVTMNVVL